VFIRRGSNPVSPIKLLFFLAFFAQFVYPEKYKDKIIGGLEWAKKHLPLTVVYIWLLL
jgi:hypothetical protein